jgi:hypothetical protein
VTTCRKGLHDLDDEANVYVTPSTGAEQCLPCKRARQAEYAAGGTTVVTLRDAGCADRFAEWGGLAVALGGRRYRVDEAQWRGYTAQVSTRPRQETHAIPRYACGERDCRVEAAPGPLANHQRASGHQGRAEL